MSALHYKAAYWVAEGVFNNLASFGEFEARVNDIVEEKDRGDVFEIFIEGYLATQSITQHKQHWVVGGIPVEMRERFNLPNDGTGIDGIYEETGGNQVAYQVKYRKNHNLTFAEVAPFLGITEKFTDRVIFTNASKLSDKAVVRTRWYSSEVFNALKPEQFDQIEAWLKEKPAPVMRATPDPSYQTEVLDDIAATLKDNARASLVMACGTGKTLVSLWATEQAKPRTVLVLLPSLMLLQQTLREWSQHTSWGSRFSYLCVCSDKTVGLRGDSINMDKSDVGFRVDTDPDLVRQFLRRETDDIKVIFSTYQSTEVVAEGAAGLPPIDLAIFDEAHKTTGRAGGMFSHALDDGNLSINKRLFLTATPRHIDIRKRDKEGDFAVQSMDDEAVYGPRAHTLSFGKAASKGIICQYKVIISLIDKQMVDDFSRNNGITLIEGDEIGARWVSNLVALDQAVKKVDASKIITFHGRVSNAQEFASTEPRGIAHYLDEYDVRHVNGKQNSSVRSDAISAFAEAPKGLITNARCLTEGVDIPAVDMVAFIDPRQSRVDIVQAVGRAMRKPRGVTTKTVGYVLVPLFAGADEESLEDAIRTEKFDAIANVLNALQEHDEELVDIVREMRQAKGEEKPFDPTRLLDKIEFIGPQVELHELVQSISIEITDRLGVSWDEMFGRLKKYREREGHCRVPAGHKEGDYRLGGWVSKQRRSKGKTTLTTERVQRLDEIGFVWDPFTADWEEGFAALEVFKKRERHCRVHGAHKEGAHRLGTWVATQRSGKATLTPERLQRLDEIGFIWDVLDADWEAGFAALEVFKKREGHCRVPARHKEGAHRLGQWVGVQRKNKITLAPERVQRLDEIGFLWDPFTADWEEGFAALKVFKKREGHCRVPYLHKEGNHRLGAWVSNKRFNKATLTAERVQRLDEIGFVWGALDADWEEGFAALAVFKKREGHCRVPARHKEGAHRLGTWVGVQRRSKTTLTAERLQRLDEIGFVWDPLTADWEAGFAALKVFKKREGHCRVHGAHKEGAHRLGQWVSTQRRSKTTLTAERLQRLEEIGFVWDPLTADWEAGFAALKAYREREGHCRVPRPHKEGDYKLGIWVRYQRKNKTTLTPERVQRLDEIGLVWDPFTANWEAGFAALEVFKEREGHCRVPQAHKEGDHRLGIWVGTQRAKKANLTPERVQRLDEIGFVWNAGKQESN